jgi:beta-lactamase class D
MNLNRVSRWLVVVVLTATVLVACSPNNVTIDNSLKTFFDENKVTGTFGIYDNGTGQFIIYNLSRFKDSSYLPASTFKIVNSLIGIETGRIADEKTVIKWDGKIRVHPGGDTATDWNKDLTMEQAFAVSALPYYQEVARRIGRDTMKRWIDSLQYGNRELGKAVDSFWINNSLKVTPDEQMGLVKRLYFGQLPFQKRTQDIVKKMMIRESNSNYILAYKTGVGFRENGHLIGWMVGWIEENKHPYFFVLNTEGPGDMKMTDASMKVLRTILKQQGFFEGKR